MSVLRVFQWFEWNHFLSVKSWGIQDSYGSLTLELWHSKNPFWGLYIFYTRSQGVAALVSASAAETRTLSNQLEQNSGYASIQLIQFGSGAQRIGTKLQVTALLLCVHTSSIYLCQLLNSFFFRIVTNWFLGVIHQTPFLRRNSMSIKV